MYTLYTQGAIEKRRRRRRRRRTEREEADGPERRPRVPVAGPLKKKGGRQAGKKKKSKAPEIEILVCPSLTLLHQRGMKE